LAAYLLTPAAQARFASATRTVAQPTLNITQIEEIPVFLPPIHLQVRFGEIARKADTVGRKLMTARSESGVLFDALAQRAFRGEL
jgi:type I restriction enzyme S subunit